MPDGDRRRQAFEQSLASILDRKEPALTFVAFVTLAGFESLHRLHFRPVSHCELVMTTTDAQDRLACVLDDFKNSPERRRRVLIPRMTPPTQDDERRAQTANSFER